jgi:CelD/BcsL family acetyltransferase involved in cellulose biosynthesis
MVTPVSCTTVVEASTTGGCFKIQVSEDIRAFAELWPRSDRMGSARCYAFQCADHLEVWGRTIGKARGTQKVFVAVFDEASRPLLLLPFGIEQGRRLRILGFLDGGVSDYNAPVIFEQARAWDAARTKSLWKALTSALPRFDIAVFEKMPAEICGIENPLANLPVLPTTPSGHFIRLTQSWRNEAGPRLPFKREAEAQRRRLAKLGQVTFEVVEDPAERRRILEAMLSQKSRRYMETWGVDGLDRPGYRSYYLELVEELSPSGPVLMAALKVDGKIIATNWGLLVSGRFIGIVMTFEGGEWRRFSPGKLLLEDLLLWCCNNGIEIFDFGVGDEGYKAGYTDEILALYKASIPVTAYAKLYHYGRNTIVWSILRRVVQPVLRRLSRRDDSHSSSYGKP